MSPLKGNKRSAQKKSIARPEIKPVTVTEKKPEIIKGAEKEITAEKQEIKIQYPGEFDKLLKMEEQLA